MVELGSVGDLKGTVNSVSCSPGLAKVSVPGGNGADSQTTRKYRYNNDIIVMLLGSCLDMRPENGVIQWLLGSLKDNVKDKKAGKETGIPCIIESQMIFSKGVHNSQTLFT